MIETIEQEARRRVFEQVGKPGSHLPGSLHALALEQLIAEHRATKVDLAGVDELVGRLLDLHSTFEGQGGKHYTAALFSECATALQSLAAQLAEARDKAVNDARSAVFEVLRRHDVSEQLFAEVAAATHALKGSQR